VPWNRINDFYAAVVHATEEAVLNSLIANAEMIGRNGHRSPALPHAAVLAAMK
jgi:L-aminopeptidase/D-esterase-like protein